MSMPPPIPAPPRRKIATVILVVCACITTIILLIFLVGYLDREGLVMFRKSSRTYYYYPADLKARNLPDWHVTNAIPLTPDQAVSAAIRHLNAKLPVGTSWEVNDIHLRNEFDMVWVYDISLNDRGSGGYGFEAVKVLMDGSIWEPTNERRER
jgi:hypothetical protein